MFYDLDCSRATPTTPGDIQILNKKVVVVYMNLDQFGITIETIDYFK